MTSQVKVAQSQKRPKIKLLRSQDKLNKAVKIILRLRIKNQKKRILLQ